MLYRVTLTKPDHEPLETIQTAAELNRQFHNPGWLEEVTPDNPFNTRQHLIEVCHVPEATPCSTAAL